MAGRATARIPKTPGFHGHEQVGPLREIYLNDPANVPPEDLLTEVLVPIAPSTGC